MSAQKKRILNFENTDKAPRGDKAKEPDYMDRVKVPFENLAKENDDNIVFDFSKLEAEDRRKEQRIPSSCMAIIYDLDRVVAKGQMHDVSHSGLSFYSFATNLELNKQYKIEINGNNILPSLLIDFEIVIAYTDPDDPSKGTRFGSLITKMSKLTHKKFQEFLDYDPK